MCSRLSKINFKSKEELIEVLRTTEKRKQRLPQPTDLRLRQAQAVAKLADQWNGDWDHTVRDLLAGGK